MIKIAATSDLHGKWKTWKTIWEEPEIVIIAGDICYGDTMIKQNKEIPEFLEKLKIHFPSASEYIIVPGNHDIWFERNPEKYLGPRFNVLVDSGIDYIDLEDGRIIKIWGNPWTECGDMAFQRNPAWKYQDLKKIPEDVDILVTHDSPRFYFLSCVKDSLGDTGDKEPGSKELAERVKKIMPELHIFGHIHKPGIWYGPWGTKFYNVASPVPAIIEY